MLFSFYILDICFRERSLINQEFVQSLRIRISGDEQQNAKLQVTVAIKN